VLLVKRLGDWARWLWLKAADTRLLGYHHPLSPMGFAPLPAARAEQTVLDLDRLPLAAPAPAFLVSHPYRSSAVPHYPSIETWTLRGGSSRAQAAAPRTIQFHTIRKQLGKTKRPLEGAFAVFPHSTSHFGHWAGDCLGAILWFARDSRVTAGGRRLLVTAPSPEWAALLEQLCPPGSVELSTPDQLLEVNWQLSDALLLPRLSPWQNLSLARDLLAPAVAVGESSFSGERLFLCSLRDERIVNLPEVIRCFERHHFTVLNPQEMEPLALLRRLRQAAELWCEHGSMALNPLLCRSQPYHLLELDPRCAAGYDPAQAVLGGGLYNGFQRGLQQPFPCPPAVESARLDRLLHPYQRQLLVDLQALEQALS
jgi:capsular polysaccharide biosynthesis protein